MHPEMQALIAGMSRFDQELLGPPNRAILERKGQPEAPAPNETALVELGLRPSTIRWLNIAMCSTVLDAVIQQDLTTVFPMVSEGLESRNDLNVALLMRGRYVGDTKIADDTPSSGLGLPSRVVDGLNRVGLVDVARIRQCTSQTLAAIPGIGYVWARKIRVILLTVNLPLSGD